MKRIEIERRLHNINVADIFGLWDSDRMGRTVAGGAAVRAAVVVGSKCTGGDRMAAEIVNVVVSCVDAADGTESCSDFVIDELVMRVGTA